MKTTLSVEESARLIELGVDPKLASRKKFVPLHPEVLKGNAKYAKPWGFFPIFELSDVIEALPKQIPYPKQNRLQVLYPFTKDGEIMVRYATFDDATVGTDFVAPELIDALNQLLCWYLTEFKKKEK